MYISFSYNFNAVKYSIMRFDKTDFITQTFCIVFADTGQSSHPPHYIL